MLFKTLLKTNILLLLILSINGCRPYVGGECKYNSIKAYAVVKEIKKDHVILDVSAKYLILLDRNQNDKEITLPLLPVHVGETIPIYIDQITKGSCVPTGYRVDKDYFRIKNNHTSALVE